MVGNYEQAVAALGDALRTAALTLDVPDLGGDPDQQLQAARRAAADPSAGAPAHVALGHVLMALDRADEARPAFERALELDATLETPRLRLAGHALSEGNTGRAIGHLEAAVRQHPSSREARRLLANAYWAADNLGAAVLQFNAALAMGPTNEQLRTSRQTMLVSAPPNAAIEAEVTAVVADHSRSGVAHQNLGAYPRASGATGRRSRRIGTRSDATRSWP